MGGTLIERLLKAPAGDIVEVSPKLCLITDKLGHKVVELVDPSRGLSKALKPMVILDHDIPAGSFESAFNQKKLIDFSRANDLAFIQSVGIGYQIVLDQFAKTDDVVCSCGRHNSFLGAKGILGLGLDPGSMAELLMAGSLKMQVPETALILLEGTLKQTVDASDLARSILAFGGESGFSGQMIEITGSGLETMSMNDRIMLCAMLTETGAVSAAIVEAPLGHYIKTVKFDLGTIERNVLPPGNLFTAKTLSDFQGVAVQAAFVGGCMGGRIESMRTAASLLKGKKVKRGVRLMIGFASNEAYLQACDEGLVEIFIEAGAQVTNPGCASCKTTSIGVIGDNEVMVSTGCYNAPGSAGTLESKIYLASVPVVVRAALTGFVA